MIINLHTAHLNYTMTYINHIYIKFIFQMFGTFSVLILFSSGGSQFGSGCPTFANINFDITKVHKMHKVDVLCGVNAFIILQGFE